MELFGDVFISAAIVVVNALYSVVAIVLAQRMPQMFERLSAISVLAILCFAFNEVLVILRSLNVLSHAASWATALPMIITVLLTPPATSNLIVRRLRTRLDPPTHVVWVFSAAAGTAVGMFLYVQLIWLEPRGV